MTSLREDLRWLVNFWGREAAGPDSITKSVLNSCRDQLVNTLHKHPEFTDPADAALEAFTREGVASKPKPKLISAGGDVYRCWAVDSEGALHQWSPGKEWRRFPGPFDGESTPWP